MPSTRAIMRARYGAWAEPEGASEKPQLPPMTVVTPCRGEGLAVGSQDELRVVVGVEVDEAGRHHEVAGVDGALRRLVGTRPPRPPRRRRTPTSARRAGAPVPSTTVPPRITTSSIGVPSVPMPVESFPGPRPLVGTGNSRIVLGRVKARMPSGPSSRP